MIKPLISRTNSSCVSGYSQLTKKTVDILKRNYDLIELPILFNKENSQEFKKLNKKTWGAPEFFITPLPDDPYFSMLNGMSPKNNCFVLTMWESTRLTRWQREEVKCFKKIIVPSQWGKIAFDQAGFKNVEIINLFVDENVFYYKEKQNYDKFIFLTGGSHLLETGNHQRKDIDQIVKLFKKAFKGVKDVELRIKLSENDYAKRKRYLDDQVKYFSFMKSESEYANFLSSGDAFISPSKSEGWGFMQIESLACGNILICPNYSSLSDYLTTENHLPVDYTEELAASNWGIAGGLWAEINEESLIEQMLYAYHNKDQIRNNSRKYYESVLPKFSIANYEKNLINFLETNYIFEDL